MLKCASVKNYVYLTWWSHHKKCEGMHKLFNYWGKLSLLNWNQFCCTTFIRKFYEYAVTSVTFIHKLIYTEENWSWIVQWNKNQKDRRICRSSKTIGYFFIFAFLVSQYILVENYCNILLIFFSKMIGGIPIVSMQVDPL